MRWLALVLAAGALAVLVLPRSADALDNGLPGSWVKVASGTAGGAVWSGRIPNNQATWDTRPSAIYLPPGFTMAKRYPVVYLLHGLKGSPSGFYSSLQLASVADGLIASGKTKPFVAVMPVAGQLVNPSKDEWAGVWENFVVHDVIPWADAHLPTVATAQGRTLAGLCAGGYGALDIGLRHPGLFGTLEAWQGYFAPVFRDGPFANASAAVLAAHNPSLLVRQQAASLRRSGVRIYLSVGGPHGIVRPDWTYSFARELRGLGLPHTLFVPSGAQLPHLWRATLPSALIYAATGAGAGAATSS